MHALSRDRLHALPWTKALTVMLFAVATAVSARISVLLPFSPVPLTLQVLVVILSGFVLGAWGGLMAQALYLQAILLGAPYTAAGLGGPAAFVGPTAGYLLAFPVAAYAAGWLSARGGRFQALWRLAGGLAAVALIYIGGAAWLSGYVGGMRQAWALGVAPFVGPDALKVVIASAVLSLRHR